MASYLPIAVGDTVDPQRLDLAIKTLFRTDLFADVALHLDPDGTLVVRVAASAMATMRLPMASDT